MRCGVERRRRVWLLRRWGPDEDQFGLWLGEGWREGERSDVRRKKKRKGKRGIIVYFGYLWIKYV